MLLCHSERSEESVVPRSIGCLQILRSAKNAELRMTESPSIIEGILLTIKIYHLPTNIEKIRTKFIASIDSG
jgi:hypothetical protein